MKKYIYIVIGLLVLAGIIFVIMAPEKPSKYNTFAQCIKDSGATFYGAFWCPHCGAQKASFGSAAKLLPYVECSTPDSRGQLQVCKDANITSYPTWDFLVGSTTKRIPGEVSLERLSQETNCPLPQE
jgi:hypothetical protein